MLIFLTKFNKTLIPKSYNLQLLSLSTVINTSDNNIVSVIKQQKTCTLKDLLTSCGFKPCSKSVSVVTFFKSFGFSDTQLKTVVTKFPPVLLSDVSRIIKPKIGFFESMGMSQQDVIKIVIFDPFLLGTSLQNSLVPAFELLKLCYGGQEIAADRIRRWPSLLRGETRKCLASNMETLRDFGVPETRILKMVTGTSCLVICASTKPCYFRKVVAAVMDIGFDLYSSSFENAVHAMTWHSESCWLKKLKVYKSLGFSEDEIRGMFKKQPISFWLSEKKIRAVAKFYFEKFNWSPSRMVKNPNALLYSLGKRVVPRCSVLQVLAMRNKVKNVHINTLLTKTEDQFLERYVNNYKDEIPEVLDAYQGKLKFDDFTFDLE